MPMSKAAAIRWAGRGVLCTGVLLLSVVPVMVGGAYAQARVALEGRVTTPGGAAAFDVVVTLAGTTVSDTTDTAGNYRLLRQGTGLSRSVIMISTDRNRCGMVGREVCIGGRLKGSPGSGGAAVYDSRGRKFDVDRLRGGTTGGRLPDGIYFLERNTGDVAAHSGVHTIGAASSADTISLSYQGTLIEKIPAAALEGTLDITMKQALPARKHSVLVASYSNNKAYILSADNQVEWEYGMPGPVQDAWQLPGGNILLSGGSDVREVTRSKEVVWKYSASAGEIHNCYPLPGNVVLFGENSSGKLYEINRATNTIVRTVQTQCRGDNHTRFRMVRKTGEGTYLIAARGENNIYELDSSGAVVRKISCDTLKNRYGINWDAVHSAVKLENGNILIGGGYNSVFIELDEKDSLVWKLSAADIPEIGFNFAAAGQILPGGTIIFGAYSSTFKLFEVTRTKKVLWKQQNVAIGDPTHVYVIDCFKPAQNAVQECDPPQPETLLR